MEMLPSQSEVVVDSPGERPGWKHRSFGALRGTEVKEQKVKIFHRQEDEDKGSGGRKKLCGTSEPHMGPWEGAEKTW